MTARLAMTCVALLAAGALPPPARTQVNAGVPQQAPVLTPPAQIDPPKQPAEKFAAEDATKDQPAASETARTVSRPANVLPQPQVPFQGSGLLQNGNSMLGIHSRP